MNRLFQIAIAALALAFPLHAQFEVNGPNAVQMVQGQVASTVDPIDHDVELTLPGTFRLTVQSGSNPNVPIATVMSLSQPTPGAVPVPWGGAIDVGSPDPVTIVRDVVVLGDGITFSGNPALDSFFFTDAGDPFSGAPPTFELSANFSATAIPGNVDVTTRAFQTIVFDPTISPLPYDNTEVADVNFVRGRQGVLQTGDDGFVTLPFVSGAFEFHGTSYTAVTVCANGYVCFGGPPTLTNLGADGDHVAFVNDQPAIAACLADWDPSAADPNDGVWFEERSGVVTISWGDPRAQSMGGIAHAGETDSNRFDLTLFLVDAGGHTAGSFIIEHFLLDASSTRARSALVGHTPGGAAILNGAFDTHLRLVSKTAGALVAQVEEHDGDDVNAMNLGYDGQGTLRCMNDFQAQWDGALIEFVPTTGFVVAGDQGYTTQLGATPNPADTATGLTAPSIARTGNQQVKVCGSFVGFDPFSIGQGTVVFDPDSVQGGPYYATVGDILDSTSTSGFRSTANPQPGPHRDGQALEITTPFMFGVTGGSTVTMRVSFASGGSVDIPVSVTATTGPTMSYQLGDDAFVEHVLSVPVTFYGQTWNSLFVGSNGYVTFGHGATTNGGGQFALETGLDVPGTPSVAVLFDDLNPLGATGPSSFMVSEDIAQGRVKVEFLNTYFWANIEFAGNLAVTFGTHGPGSFQLDYGLFFPSVAGTAPVTIGVSDGNPATPATDVSDGMGGGFYSLTAAGGGSGYMSSVGGDSVLETFPRNTDLLFSQPLTFIDMATSAPYGLWSIF